jgi:hypothetical protein
MLPIKLLVKLTIDAYIDPNTGGMLFQVLAVLFAAFSGILLFFSRQIKTTFARLMRRLRGDTEEPPSGGESPSGDDAIEDEPGP